MRVPTRQGKGDNIKRRPWKRKKGRTRRESGRSASRHIHTDRERRQERGERREEGPFPKEDDQGPRPRTKRGPGRTTLEGIVQGEREATRGLVTSLDSSILQKGLSHGLVFRKGFFLDSQGFR